MVNQDGRVSATTSVSANGSVILQAADTATFSGTTFAASHGGTVELGPGSITEVLPDYADTTTAVQAQTQLQSSVSITGEQVLMHAATIDAPSGKLSVVAASDPSLGVQSTGDPGAQIRIDAGTTIDLAGSDAELPMSANLVSVQLRSNELADDPTQRGGALQSTPTNTVTVTVDVRADGGAGTHIADVSSAIAAVGQTIAQRTEKGGTASFQSQGDVVLSSGATINVSGGYTTYLGGTIQTTQLVGANGQLYDIGSANPLLTYTGVVNPTFTQTYDKWGIQEVIPTPGLSHYESTYVQGASAGTVQFAAPSMLLAGSLQATAQSGPYQRSAPPSGGTLIIGESVATSTNLLDYLAPSISFAANQERFCAADQFGRHGFVESFDGGEFFRVDIGNVLYGGKAFGHQQAAITSSTSSASTNKEVRRRNSSCRRSLSSASVRMSISQRGQLRRQTHILAAAADGEAELIVGNDHFDTRAGFLVQNHLGDLGRSQGVDDERGRVPATTG